jgi:hypothetical protein
MRSVVSQKLTDVSEVLTVLITTGLMMEEISTSETSVNFYETTWRNVTADSRLFSSPWETDISQIPQQQIRLG